jgi:hypothetical protein
MNSPRTVYQVQGGLRFVPHQVKFDNNSIAELPAHETCITVEDAHKQTELERLIYSVLNESAYTNKIIITTRPSGLESIRECLRDYAQNPMIVLIGFQKKIRSHSQSRFERRQTEICRGHL